LKLNKSPPGRLGEKKKGRGTGEGVPKTGYLCKGKRGYGKFSKGGWKGRRKEKKINKKNKAEKCHGG